MPAVALLSHGLTFPQADGNRHQTNTATEGIRAKMLQFIFVLSLTERVPFNKEPVGLMVCVCAVKLESWEFLLIRCWILEELFRSELSSSCRGELKSASDMKLLVKRRGARQQSEKALNSSRAYLFILLADLSGTCHGSHPMAAGFEDLQRNWEELRVWSLSLQWNITCVVLLCVGWMMHWCLLICHHQGTMSRISLELIQK